MAHMGGVHSRSSPQAAILPLLKARWACPVSHWHNLLAAVFVPVVGLQDIITHTETLAKFTQQDLRESWQSLSLLNIKMSLMRKATLQNQIASDIIPATQGGTLPFSRALCAQTC